ncbi:hypothetical protein V8F20_012709 [Naviculisporaceae sp. PSN 640]
MDSSWMDWHEPYIAKQSYNDLLPLQSYEYTYKHQLAEESTRLKLITVKGCIELCGHSVQYVAASTLPRPVLPSNSFDQSGNVSWQMAWWSLVPLAIAGMTQPCGNVLGRRDKNFRFYSRASPIICIVDFMHFVICLTFGWSFNPRTFIRNVKFEVLERFSDSDEASGQNHGDAERTRLMRWALLVISGVPCQTIKLSAMRGMFCTKFWAISFFGSLLFWEVLSIVARSIQTNHTVQLPIPRWRQGSSRLLGITGLMSDLAMAFHFFAVYEAAATLFYWAMFSVSDLQLPHAIAITTCLALLMALLPLISHLFSRRRFSYNLTPGFVALGCMVLGEVITAQGVFTPLLLSKNSDIWKGFREGLQNYLLHERSPPKLAFAKLLIPWTEISLGMSCGTIGYIAFHVFEVLCATFFFLGIPRLFDIPVLRWLFKVNTRVGSDAVFIFISTFLFSFLWYYFMFQPAGTYSPEWTEMFN